jgi:hypothetical protein
MTTEKEKHKQQNKMTQMAYKRNATMMTNTRKQPSKKKEMK